MCGFLGLAGGDSTELVKSFALALPRLQHRGPESAGGSWTDSHGRVHGTKGMGLVSQLLDMTMLDRIEKHKPSMIIGHTRYATAGEGARKNAQPQWLENQKGRVSIALNGDVPNLDQRKIELFDSSGAVFHNENDAEFILKMIFSIIAADNPDWKMDYIYAIEKVMRTLTATFSGGLLTGTQMYVFRDRYENRPLFIGQKNGTFVSASETGVFDLIGATIEREVKGGEIIAVAPNGEYRSIIAMDPGPLAKCIFEAIYFSRPDSIVFGNETGASFRRRLGIATAKYELERNGQFPEADCVVSVPQSGDYFTDGYSWQSKIIMRNGIMKDAYTGRTFISPGQAARRLKAIRKYTVLRDVPNGVYDAEGNVLIKPMKKVIVCDDSIVRLTTAKVLAKKIRQAGYEEIHFRISAPMITDPCFFGIDMKTHDQLIAAKIKEDEIRQELDIASLLYLPLKWLDRVIVEGGGDASDYCRTCFGAPCKILLEKKD
ncbi:MAG: amidophosphoribosyltransferase [Candidatus Kerfeldbacteria bacterium]